MVAKSAYVTLDVERYGINFGSPAIPENIKRKWAIVHTTRNCHLQGATDSLPMLNSMRVQMDNGRRQIRIDTIAVGREHKTYYCLVECW